MSRPKGINWDKQPLGTVRDAELAHRLGVALTTVFVARQRRGIPAYRDPLRRPAIDWDKQPLGQVSDTKIARTLGVTQSAVTRARACRGIPPLTSHVCIDWANQPLGLLPDDEIARRLGVSTKTVAKARKRRGGIKHWHPPKGIDWDAQPLGQMPDSKLARRLGTTPAAVSVQRRKRGIQLPARPPSPPAQVKCRVDKCKRRRAPGRRTCVECLAKNLASARKKRGIPLDAPVEKRASIPSLAERAKKVGLAPVTVAVRRHRGWSVKRALGTPAERTDLEQGLRSAEREMLKRSGR